MAIETMTPSGVEQKKAEIGVPAARPAIETMTPSGVEQEIVPALSWASSADRDDDALGR